MNVLLEELVHQPDGDRAFRTTTEPDRMTKKSQWRSPAR